MTIIRTSITPTAMTSHTISDSCLIEAMVPDYRYTHDEVCALLYDSPKAAVREKLRLLVARGAIWRDASGTRAIFLRPSDAALQAEMARKTVRTQQPAWMHANLSGYDAALARQRDLALASRGPLSAPTPRA